MARRRRPSEGDTLARRLGMEAACRRDAAALGDEARAMLEAYAAGVNAFLASGAPRAGGIRAARRDAGALGGLALPSR